MRLLLDPSITPGGASLRTPIDQLFDRLTFGIENLIRQLLGAFRILAYALDQSSRNGHRLDVIHKPLLLLLGFGWHGLVAINARAAQRDGLRASGPECNPYPQLRRRF